MQAAGLGYARHRSAIDSVHVAAAKSLRYRCQGIRREINPTDTHATYQTAKRNRVRMKPDRPHAPNAVAAVVSKQTNRASVPAD